MATQEPPLIVIVGETASGKTTLGIELAKKFNGEIICADSRTIYSGMDIGTAKPTPQERKIIPHHLLDIRIPKQTYTVAQFQRDAKRCIDKITARGHLPIMVGGSGLYVDAVIFNYSFANKGERDVLNPRHVASNDAPKDHKIRSNTSIIGVRRDTAVINERINHRVTRMLDDGLLDETQSLVKLYGRNNEVLRGSGYYIWDDYLHGILTLDEAKVKFVRMHKLLAKKQRTWFKRNKSIQWLDNGGGSVAIATTFLKKSSV